MVLSRFQSLVRMPSYLYSLVTQFSTPGTLIMYSPLRGTTLYASPFISRMSRYGANLAGGMVTAKYTGRLNRLVRRMWSTAMSATSTQPSLDGSGCKRLISSSVQVMGTLGELSRHCLMYHGVLSRLRFTTRTSVR